MKVLFWGTPETAVPFLELLHRKNPVSAVITQPDKSSDRGLQIHPPPVKIFAQSKGITVLQPEKLKDPSFAQVLEALGPELGIVVAYGKFIPRTIINMFPKGLFNVHFSVLPERRGAAPMQRAILEGDRRSGVTIFQIAEEMDSGDVLVQKSLEISETEDAVSLEQKLILLGLEALDEALRLIQSGSAVLTPQKGMPTFAPQLQKMDAQIDWNRPAQEIARQVRALVRMGAFCRTPGGKILKILECEAASENSNDPAGTITRFERQRGFVVKCKKDGLLVLRVQMEGKNVSDAWSYLQGARLKEGDALANKPEKN